MSLSARRAWIEITPPKKCSNPGGVALRKESVDRNPLSLPNSQHLSVALRKESVDRNKYVVQCRKILGVSLSARRAWIEMRGNIRGKCECCVALRKESVDRN